MSSACDNMLECNHLPDACTNDVREENLMARQRKDDDRPWFQRVLERDRNLLFACVVLIVVMNVPEGRYILFPFKIFSTWIHEMCHALACKLTLNGYVAKIQVFKDGGGLTFTSTRSTWKAGFVSSGGYPGTAVTGFVLLLFRRTTLGPTIGMIFLGVASLLSSLVWIRNNFGLWFVTIQGIVMILCAWKLPAHFLDNLFNFLAVTCSLNAIENVKDLYSYEEGTDAQSVASFWGGDYRMWATIWLWMSIGFTAAGIAFAFDARQVPSCIKDTTDSTTTYVGSTNGTVYYGGSRTSSTNYTKFGTPAQVV